MEWPKGCFFSDSVMRFSNLPKNVPKTYLEQVISFPGKFLAHFLGDLKNASYFLKKAIFKSGNRAIKVPIFKECHFGKMKLWQVEHFHNIFVFTFGRDCYCIQQSRPKVKTNML